MILVAGGEADPNIVCIRRRLAERGIGHLTLVGEQGRWPRLAWSLHDDTLRLDGAAVEPSAIFVRFDVFSGLAGAEPHHRVRAASWYYAALSWALAHEEVALLNRAYATTHAAKPYVLRRAQFVGLEIVDTWVTNDLGLLDGLLADAWIVKPIDGGAYTRTLRDMCSDAAALQRVTTEPTLLQQRLAAPDLRIYRVGEAWFAFHLCGDGVDYRSAAGVVIEPTTPSPELIGPLSRLMDGFGLDFGAADFKRNPANGRFAFLEVNSAPMFAAFDRQVGGAIGDAIIDWLVSAG